MKLLRLMAVALLAFLLSFTISGVFATEIQQVEMYPGSVVQTSIVSISANIPAVSTTVSLGVPCTHIQIWTSSGAANLHIQPNGTTCTASQAIIYPGSAETFICKPITSFTILGDSALGQYNVIAD